MHRKREREMCIYMYMYIDRYMCVKYIPFIHTSTCACIFVSMMSRGVTLEPRPYQLTSPGLPRRSFLARNGWFPGNEGHVNITLGTTHTLPETSKRMRQTLSPGKSSTKSTNCWFSASMLVYPRVGIQFGNSDREEWNEMTDSDTKLAAVLPCFTATLPHCSYSSYSNAKWPWIAVQAAVQASHSP